MTPDGVTVARSVPTIQAFEQEFGLWKLKIFGPRGEILYSTEPAEVGTVNQAPYFRTEVAKGHNFVKLVCKETPTLEGLRAAEDLVETYVPIFAGTTFVGAFEVYYNVTASKQRLDHLLFLTSTLPATAMAGFLAAMVLLHLRSWRTEERRLAAEAELRSANETLETRVAARTSALTEANRELQQQAARREQMAAALSASEERLRVTWLSIAEGVVSVDREGRVLLFNPAAEALSGQSQEEVFGARWETVLPLVDAETRRPRPELAAPPAPSQPVPLRPRTATCALVRPDGSEKLLEVSVAALPAADGAWSGAVLVLQDVTLRKKTEGELRRAEKLESLSVLAGGIAHDFNNLLTGIVANIAFAQRQGSCAEPARQRLDAAEQATLRARGLAQQLLTFARGGAPVKVSSHLGEIIVEATGFGLHGSGVVSEFAFAPDLATAEVDPDQVGQVIQNLALNARQAMAGHGTLRIRAENTTLNAGSEVSLPPGPYVRIVVSDDGPGIPAAVLPRLFDPYFTTKQQGTGLGLRVCHSVIQRHDGAILATSPPGGGARFTLYLPASDQPVALPPEDCAVPAPGADSRVLLMDDDEMIRDAVPALLENLGYTVETAANGEEAIAMYQAALGDGNPYRGVIMDLTVIGGMGGKEAILHLREIDPGVRALVSSGYNADPVMANFAAHGFVGVLAKPYAIASLQTAMRQLVTGA